MSALLPAERKLERPRPRRSASAMIATPRAALGREGEARLAGEPGREGGGEADRGVGVDEAPAVGAEEAHPRPAADAQQLALKGPPLVARFREPGRDHRQRPDLLARALSGGF